VNHPIGREDADTIETQSQFVEAFVHECCTDFAYVPKLKQWMSWNGKVWVRECDTGAVQFAVRKFAEEILPEKKGMGKQLRTQSGIKAVVDMAQAHQQLRVDLNLLDTHGFELNTIDGIVDLTTGRLALGGRDRSSYHTKITGCGYSTSTDWRYRERWTKFLDTTFGGDQELIDYMQKLLGYTCIGKVTHHLLPFCHGGGDNGKSVLLETVMKVLGDYAIPAPANFLLAGHSEHQTEIAMLQGARFVLCSEVNQGDRFDEAKVKLLTGGDTLTGRFMRADYQRFTPTHCLFLMGNHLPSIPAGGHAMRRRLRLIPFNHKMPVEEQIQDYADILFSQEGPAILAWMVAGAVAVIRDGLGKPPECVNAATDEYAESEDAISQFISDACYRVTNDFKLPSGQVYRAYAIWCKGNGIPAKAASVFSRELSTNHQIKVGPSNGKRYIWGLKPAGTDQDTTGWYESDD
jgi:P4 family phage/plasmid primase-like protien